MSREKFENKKEVTNFYSPEGDMLKFGDEVTIREKKMTPYGMSDVSISVILTKDNVEDLVNKGIIVQKREKKEWEPSLALQLTIDEVINDVVKHAVANYEYYIPFISLLQCIKVDMYGTESNAGCEYGLNLTGTIGKFTAPVVLGYPLFKSPDDVNKAVSLINTLYMLVHAD